MSVPALATVAAVGIAISVSGPSATPAGKIAFSAQPARDLYRQRILAVDKPGGRPVVIAGGQAAEVAVSPDGGHIAFVRDDKDVWVANADGSGPRLVAEDASAPSWSPNGAMLAYVRGIPGAVVEVVDLSSGTTRDVYNSWIVGTVRLDGHVERTLDVSGTDIAWSSDGSMLALTSSNGITVMDMDGGNRRQIGGSGAQDPTWSPDGRRIAFVLVALPIPEGLILPNRIATIALDGTGERIVAERFNATDPAWQPVR